MTEISATEQSGLEQVLHVLRTSLFDLEGSQAYCRDLRLQLELLNQENSNLNKTITECTKELDDTRAELEKTASKKAS